MVGIVGGGVVSGGVVGVLWLDLFRTAFVSGYCVLFVQLLQ